MKSGRGEPASPGPAFHNDHDTFIVLPAGEFDLMPPVNPHDNANARRLKEGGLTRRLRKRKLLG